MVNESDLLSILTVSKELGYTVQHTRRLVREGQLRGTKFGRDWVIYRESMTEYARRKNTVPLFPVTRKGRPARGERCEP